ncbi:MAG: CDGSH iron-sulfur domain-containing protein [Bacteroidales bacterium]
MEEKTTSKKTVIEIVDKGPIIITGDISVVGYPSVKNYTAICRCSNSSTLPYCSGAHDTTDQDR